MRTLGFALLAGALWAQQPGPVASIQIVTDVDDLLVGQSMDLKAIVRDAQGRTRTGDVVSWTTDNRNIAEIGQLNGSLRAVGLGVVLVRATVGGTFVEAPIQTLAREVQITPRSGSLEIGKDMQFRAVALDANGQPIPNVNFTWSVANKSGGGTSLATVSNTGMVRGVYEGGITVRATYSYNRAVTGMGRQLLVSAPVDVFVPRAYELVKLYNNREARIRNGELRARNSMLWGTDDGQLFFNASVAGMGNALVNWQGDSWKVVSAGGTTRFAGGSFATDLRIHSITASGRMLTLEATNGAGLQVNRGDRNGVTPFLANGAPLAGTENGNNFFLTRNSYTESGWVLVRASYRVPGTTINGVGIFRGYGERITELLASNLETFPGLTPAPGALPNLDNDFGITDDGVAYYTVSAGTGRILYRHQIDREKVVGVGDSMLDSTVRSFLGGGGNRPTFFVSESGDLLYGVVLNNNFQWMIRLPKGASAPQTLRMNSQSGFLWHNSAAGTVLYGNPLGSRGNGIHLWAANGTQRPIVVFGQTPVFGQQVQDCEAGHINAAGEISLMMRLVNSNMVIARSVEGVDQPWVLFQHGDKPVMELTPNLLNIVGGARVGPPHFMTGGESGSVSVVSGTNAMEPVVAIGERLFGTQMWFGGSTNNSNWNMRKSPDGDLYFTNGLGSGA